MTTEGVQGRSGAARQSRAMACDRTCLMTVQGVAGAVGADLENGLTSQEASRRLSANGPSSCAPRRHELPGAGCWRTSRIPSSTCCWPCLLGTGWSSSRAACATPLMRVCAEHSNSRDNCAGVLPARTRSIICWRNSAGYGGRVRAWWTPRFTRIGCPRKRVNSNPWRVASSPRTHGAPSQASRPLLARPGRVPPLQRAEGLLPVQSTPSRCKLRSRVSL